MNEATLTIDQGFLLERDPDIGRVTLERLAKKSGRRYPSDREGIAL